MQLGQGERGARAMGERYRVGLGQGERGIMWG